MATQPPFAFLEGLSDRLQPLLAPALDEGRRRLVLTLNHVLQQEPQALQRLARQKGRVVQVRWRRFELALRTTPAGLLDLAPAQAVPDLTLTVSQDSPWELAQTVLRSERPQVVIADDVQLAAEINWVVDHVRWDAEEDLSRLMGDAPAHALAQAVRPLVAALQGFLRRGPQSGTPGASS